MIVLGRIQPLGGRDPNRVSWNIASFAGPQRCGQLLKEKAAAANRRPGIAGRARSIHSAD